MTELQPWVIAILAHPVTKQNCNPKAFKIVQGIIDARVYLKNTHGYSEWAEGQDEYENDANKGNTSFAEYQAGIDGARPVYQHYQMSGRILDCGGGQAQCVNIYQMMWSLFQQILGYRHLLPAVRHERLHIPA
jgi:hypothetical protein